MTSQVRQAGLCAAALVFFGAACGDSAAPVSSTSPAGDGGADAAASDEAECDQLNETRACTCDGEPGAQRCTIDGWSECACLAVPETLESDGGAAWYGGGGNGSLPTPAGNLRSDIKFTWERTTPTAGSCEPGRYEGTFQGLYASGLTFVGAPIPVAALGTPGHPGLAFTLAQTADGEQLEISDGVLEGVADGLFPFRGTITGKLDCKTLQFDAILDGYYSLGVDGVGMFKFKGPIPAVYDKVAHVLTMGTWDVKEYDPPPLVSHAGGFGTWEASWVP